MFLVPSRSCLCQSHWSQMLSREWRCSWSSAGNARTTPEWPTIWMPTKVQLLLEVYGTCFYIALLVPEPNNPILHIEGENIRQTLFQIASCSNKKTWDKGYFATMGMIHTCLCKVLGSGIGVHSLASRDQGLGLLSLFSPFRYFPIFWGSSKHCLPVYLTSVTSAQLQRHLTNMNVIEKI